MNADKVINGNFIVQYGIKLIEEGVNSAIYVDVFGKLLPARHPTRRHFLASMCLSQKITGGPDADHFGIAMCTTSATWFRSQTLLDSAEVFHRFDKYPTLVSDRTYFWIDTGLTGMSASDRLDFLNDLKDHYKTFVYGGKEIVAVMC